MTFQHNNYIIHTNVNFRGLYTLIVSTIESFRPNNFYKVHSLQENQFRRKVE